MYKRYFSVFTLLCFTSVYAVSNFFATLNTGFGLQNISSKTISNTYSTPSLGVSIGYQIINNLIINTGYLYILPTNNISDLNGKLSTLMYDFYLQPSYTIPATTISIFSIVGVSLINTCINQSFFSQLIQKYKFNFEWGGGFSIGIPNSNVFISTQYKHINNFITPNKILNFTSSNSLVNLSIGMFF